MSDQVPPPSLEPPVLAPPKNSSAAVASLVLGVIDLLMPLVAVVGSAVASLAFGIVAMCCFGPLTGIPAIILGIVALSAIAQSQGLLKGRGMAIGGITLGIVSILTIIGLMAAVILQARTRGGEAVQRASCQNNMKQIALFCKLYAHENSDLWPPLSPVKGRLMFNEEQASAYLQDLSLLHCPGNSGTPLHKSLADPFNDQSYLYLGYVLENEAQLRLFADACKSPDFDPTQDIPVPEGQGNGGGSVIYRLREGVERFLIQDMNLSSAYTQSRIPIFMDRPSLVRGELVFNHSPNGGSVCFMDGHVEFLLYPRTDRFPMTRGALEILHEIASLSD